jgi:peptide-methionine (S)-S-oxide reductase
VTVAISVAPGNPTTAVRLRYIGGCEVFTIGGRRIDKVISLFKQRTLPSAADALPGRSTVMAVPARHDVLGAPLRPPFPITCEQTTFGLGCFWGAERRFWTLPGVFTTAVGYAGGHTPNPTYEEVCSGRTGHAEVVLVVFDPAATSYGQLLKCFWESHDPSQGMRQGNDVGTQYRSIILTHGPAQHAQAQASLRVYQSRLSAAGGRPITTEIVEVGAFYYAEAYHQQYLAKNPGGYCGLGGTGVTCPVEALAAADAS